MSAKQEACINIQWRIVQRPVNVVWLGDDSSARSLPEELYCHQKVLGGHGTWTREMALKEDLVLSGWSSPLASSNRDGLANGIDVHAVA